MLLWSGKVWPRTGAEDFTGDVSLETAENLSFGKALRSSPACVLLGAEIAHKPGHDDPPECSVAAPIAAPVEAMTLRAT